MYFLFNELEVSVNDGIFSGNELQKMYSIISDKILFLDRMCVCMQPSVSGILWQLVLSS